ncbi:MAG TPA: type II toxin-antitoxin system HigB family toxin [Gammaproteobacteria bacterium]|nr:type II toxin-antitoxin system HigB family toxin [Gammaproteobacteria bacterium]
MRVIALRTLREFWQRHPQDEIPLRAWHAVAIRADWKTPADVKADYRQTSFLAGNRVVFNIKGNDYRLIAALHYRRGLLYVRFVGTHRNYDRIDAATI